MDETCCMYWGQEKERTYRVLVGNLKTGVDGRNAVRGDYQEIGWKCMHWLHLPEDRNV